MHSNTDGANCKHICSTFVENVEQEGFTGRCVAFVRGWIYERWKLGCGDLNVQNAVGVVAVDGFQVAGQDAVAVDGLQVVQQ